jgi:hypothetical protein
MNSLSLVVFSAFVVFLSLQAVFGWQVYNRELIDFGRSGVSFWTYLGTGHFGEAVFENWESEFLQMGSYVLLTAYLVQRGSAESKPLDQTDRAEDLPKNATTESPGSARRGGFALALYRNSLAIVMLGCFLLMFVAHLLTGTAEYNEQQALQSGGAAGQRVGLPGHSGILVPVHAELAERVPRRRRPRRTQHLPAPARLTTVQARHRTTRPNWIVMSPQTSGGCRGSRFLAVHRARRIASRCPTISKSVTRPEDLVDESRLRMVSSHEGGF